VAAQLEAELGYAGGTDDQGNERSTHRSYEQRDAKGEVNMGCDEGDLGFMFVLGDENDQRDEK
jgi:hypothetical protein